MLNHGSGFTRGPTVLLSLVHLIIKALNTTNRLQLKADQNSTVFNSEFVALLTKVSIILEHTNQRSLRKI